MSAPRHWRRRLGPLYGLAVALQFFTRLPMPRDLDPAPEDLGRASPWLPVVGLIVGAALATLAWALAQTPLVPGARVALLLTLGVLMTGGFHEDGLADTLDGLGGAWRREDKLRIMRDSRIGSYGALALILMMLWRAGALWGAQPSAWPAMLILAHLLGRWSTLPLILWMPYAREEHAGAGKPLVQAVRPGHVALGSALSLALCAAVSLAMSLVLGLDLATSAAACAAAAASALVITALGALVLRAQLGGITGDTLGAVNVTCELAALTLLAAWAPATHSPWVMP